MKKIVARVQDHAGLWEGDNTERDIIAVIYIREHLIQQFYLFLECFIPIVIIPVIVIVIIIVIIIFYYYIILYYIIIIIILYYYILYYIYYILLLYYIIIVIPVIVIVIIIVIIPIVFSCFDLFLFSRFIWLMDDLFRMCIFVIIVRLPLFE